MSSSAGSTTRAPSGASGLALLGRGERQPDEGTERAGATKARLSDPYGLAFDAKGNLYVAEPDEGVVRRIDTRGVITTFAGTGQLGFSGDRGPANRAKLNAPFGLVMDAAGNLYIADNGNGRIRRADRKGVITTFFNGR